MSQLQSVLTFDGIDDYIEVPYSEKHNPKVFTISCWVKPTNLTSDQKLISTWHQPSANNGYVLSITSTCWHFYQSLHTGAIHTPSKPLSNIWSHVAVTLDGTKATLYVNGKTEGQLTIPVQSVTVNTYGSLYIGAANPRRTAAQYFFAGQIAEVCIWNKARTQQEIQSDMSKRLTGKEVGLVGYWPLNEGSGNTATDKTSNGKNGIIKGATWKQEEIPLTPIEPISGEFQIPTNSITGVEFTNKQTTDISYKFTPFGTWKPKSDFPDCTAAGLKGFIPELQTPYLEGLKPYQQYLKYQNNTYFALVAVNKTTGVVTEVDKETTIALKAGETLIFVVNDLTVNYADNTGTLTVKWSAT